MSARQARIAASLGVIRALKAGERLVQRGDPGGSLFVVLDGLVEVSLPTEGGHQKIGVISRGELLGETAIFRGQRTANADAKTDVRLLRLSRDCLDRIQRRHPRVAAPLLRNLSEIMAEHAADNMERLAAARPK